MTHYMLNNNKTIFSFINVIIFISTSTIFLILYLIQKNNCIYYNQNNKNLKKQLIFYNSQIISQQGDITGLRRSDRIRNIAETDLNMYIPNPESLTIVIHE